VDEAQQKAIQELSKVGIGHRPRSAQEKIKRYHYKIMTIDNQLSLILTFNPTEEPSLCARLWSSDSGPEIATELSVYLMLTGQAKL
jgi:hypothetical protein